MRRISLVFLCAIGFTIDATAQVLTNKVVDQFGDPLPEDAVARIGTLRWNGRFTYDLAYSPDGKRLAAQCSDHTFRIYDAENGRELRRFSGTKYGDQDYYYWNWETESQPSKKNSIPKFPPRESVRLPCSSGSRRVSVTAENRIRVVDKNTTMELALFGPLGKPEMAVFSPDGSFLAIGDNKDFSIHLWDMNQRKKLGECRGHETELGTLIFSADRKSLISTARDLTVRCWNPTMKSST